MSMPQQPPITPQAHPGQAAPMMPPIGMPPPTPTPPMQPPPVPPPQPGPPPTTLPAGLPPLPPPLPPELAVDGPPKPKLPVPGPIKKDSKIFTRQPSHEIKNPFERTASLIVETAEDYAKHLAGNLSDQPADSEEVDPKTVNQMMHFSPFGADAPRQFWQVHDKLLSEAAANNDPDPYAVAERGALDEVYPYRARLALLDILAPEQRVERAAQLMRAVESQVAKGESADTMPFLTTPSALPPLSDKERAQAPEPEAEEEEY